jgi:polar amino acid transport system substrate-binding protein
MFKNMITVVLLVALSNVAKSDDKVYLFTEQLPPYSMTISGKPFAHSANDVTGLCVDIVKEVFKSASVPYKMKLRNWSYGISKVSRSINNGIFCTARTAEREKQFKWVGPITNHITSLFAKPGSDIVLETLEDARKYKIGGYKGDFMSEYFTKNGFDFSTVNNDVMNPSRLKQGSIDLWVAEELVGPYIASDALNMEDLTQVYSFEPTPVYLALNPETSDATVKKLQAALDTARSSGKLYSLEQLYGR